MKSAEKIEQLVKKMRFSPDASANKRILKYAEAALKQRVDTAKSNRFELNIWKLIMNKPITKLATAAVIIIAVFAGINHFGGSVDIVMPAYALEQTIQANHTVRYIHIKNFKAGEDEPKEFWLEFDEYGQMKNARVHLPEWDSPEDGPKLIVWKENKAQIWLKKKNIFATIKDKTVAAHMLKFVEELDPRLAVERLYEREAQGKVEIEIEEPSNKAEPIVVTATYLPESSTPGRRGVLFVDQATKLITAIELYELKDGEYQYLCLMEYYDYNQPIEPEMFVLDEVPDDALKIDQTIQEVGLAQGELSDEEIAVEVVRQFFEALIAENYAKAGKLLEGIPADRIQQGFGHIKFLRIVSIEQPSPHPIPETRGLVVPCTVEIEKDGKISEWRLDQVGVRQVYNQPDRWTIFGGI